MVGPMNHPTKILKLSRVYDLGDLYDDSRLIGFEVAVVDVGMHGARMNLVASPPWASHVQLDTDDTDPVVG